MNRLFIFLVFQAVLLLLFLVSAAPTQAIIGRHDVDAAEYLLAEEAYAAVFNFFENGGAGTLIAPEWAVTAAHVGRDIPQDGSHSVEIGGKSYLVDGVVLHPDWSQSHFNDIALVRLAEPVEWVEPIRLYRKNDETGQVAILVGRGDFGNGLTGATVMDGRLRAATNIVEKIETGSIWFAFDAPDSPNATPLEGVSGPGDSGGPAFLEVDGIPHIIGVSSFSIGLGEDPPGPGHYGIWDTYTNISSFQDWIDETMTNGVVESDINVAPEIDEAGQESADSSTGSSNQIAETSNFDNQEAASEPKQNSAGVNFYIIVTAVVIILALVGIIIALTIRIRRLSQHP